MNNTIWKYPIEITDGRQSLPIPDGVTPRAVIAVGEDPAVTGTFAVWVMVTTGDLAPGFYGEVEVEVLGTGHDTSDWLPSDHVGTVRHGPFLIWHVFAEVS